MEIPYRNNESIYVFALQDHVTVIFSTEFKEDTDKIFGKVFLQVIKKWNILFFFFFLMLFRYLYINIYINQINVILCKN